MGIFDVFKIANGGVRPDFLAGPNRVASAAVLSPWSDGQLQQFVWSDVFGIENLPVTRKEAMSVPAIAAGRNRIIGELSNKPMRSLDANGPVGNQPAWLYRTDSGVPLWHRAAQTFDDWIFYGDSLWSTKRGSKSQILDAARIPYDAWEVDADLRILVNGSPVDPDAVLYLPGPFDGLLNVAGTTVRAAKSLELAWAGRVRNPTPTTILKEREADSISQERATYYVNTFAAARRKPDGTIAFIPAEIDVELHGDDAADLMIEARNAVRIDIANFLNLTTEEVQGSKNASTLKYETDASQQTTLDNRLSFWTSPLEERLSMDDVCPRGQRIRFDFSDNPDQPGGDTGPYKED